MTVASLFTSDTLLLLAMFTSFLAKLFLMGICIRFLTKKTGYQQPIFFVMLFLTGCLIEECANFLYLFGSTCTSLRGEIPLYTFICRLGQAFKLSQYHALALFIEHLTTKRIYLGFVQLSSIVANIAISSSFLYLAIFKYSVLSSSPITLPFEILLVKWIHILAPLLFIQPAYMLYTRFKNKRLPSIIRHQIKTTLIYVIPFVFLGLINSRYSFAASWLPFFGKETEGFQALAALISTCGLYIIGRKMLGLRFLNMRSDVASKTTFDLLTRCADILDTLRYATAVKELAHLTQTFFHSAFDVPRRHVTLYIRNESQHQDSCPAEVTELHDPLSTYTIVEKQLQEKSELLHALDVRKLFIRDELEFNYHYNEDPQSAAILAFLDTINASIFLPIYERSSIIAYIIIARDARSRQLFTGSERDEMLVFTTYVSNILIMLKNRTFEELLFERKQLADELFHKHQEINQYKESIRSFLRAHKERKIGILYYKNRRFTIANEAGRDLTGFDLNVQDGHPLVQTLKSIARRVEEYKTAQVGFSTDSLGNKIVISGLLSAERSVILLMYYPEIADILRDQLANLKDPSRWDYLLYLETTKSGKLVDALLPGRSEKILTFKIELLAAALNKKAAILLMNEEDLVATVEILHAISMREKLHIMKVTSPEQHDAYALELFGLNALMGASNQPLLEKLNEGTLFIQNIENISLSTQELLARFIYSGTFEKLKSNQSISSNARILCSSKYDLKELVREGSFSRELYNALEKTILSMPSVHDLSELEMQELAQGFAEHIIPATSYNHLLTLTAKDATQLSEDRPTSFAEFKNRVYDILHEKSDKLSITECTNLDPAYNEPNPAIAQAVRMGKRALKDPQIMALLWSKFKNQNKIAQLLRVNRSSVNRRCHEYGLL